MKHIESFPFYLAIVVLSLTSGLLAETAGTLRGELVGAPQGNHVEETLCLMGRDGNVRSVRMTGALVTYEAEVAAADRTQPAREALVPGTEVRITATWDAEREEWTASKVEVIPHHAAAFEDDYGDGAGGPDPVTAPMTPVIDTRTI